MPTPMYRESESQEVVLAATVEASTTITMGRSASLAIWVGTLASVTTVTWWGANQVNGPYYRVIKSDGQAATTDVTTGSRCYVAPPELFACPYIKGTSSAGSLTVGVAKKT